MATFTGFTTADLATIQGDFQAAEQRCMKCLNSLVLSMKMEYDPQAKDLAPTYVLSAKAVQLLTEAFSTDGSDEGLLETIKNTFAGFRGRAASLSVSYEPQQAAPNQWDFAAFVKSSEPNKMFIRPEYFRAVAGGKATAKPQLDRVLALIHEYVHLRFPTNPGDGHPGGQFLSFGRGPLGVAANDAVRNPYCYEYYAQFVS
jgi:hypothetical protein